MDGERQATTKQQAVRPWWKTDPSGQVVMSVKFGAKLRKLVADLSLDKEMLQDVIRRKL